MHLVLQFVDGIYGIDLVGGIYSRKTTMVLKLSNGMLKLHLEVLFLDLTLTIEDRNSVSNTYQKPLNLCQYLCSDSANLPWVPKGAFFSMLKRYYHQNSYMHVFWEITILL